MGIDGSETSGHEKVGKEISGKVKDHSGSLNHSGREIVGQLTDGTLNSGKVKVKSGNLSHSGRENLSHSNEISGQAKFIFGSSGNVMLGRLNLGNEGRVIFGKLILGRVILGKEMFLGGSW